MKKIIILITFLLITITLTGCNDIDNVLDSTTSDSEGIIDSEDSNIYSTETALDNLNYGSAGAMENTIFTIEEMLIYAIQDEYAARQEYSYIITNFDVTKPFSNIMTSEETHIDLLLPLFEAYSITNIEDTSQDHIVTINSLEEAFTIGVQAEILNIAMYNLFLEQTDLPEDIHEVFIKLRDASINHLDAFQKNLDRY